ncbi:aldose epimerase family protein [Costertonia aggregata]|uniref:Aldose 1-epimerase n=1 Tax=Costertonia aggregata TaxID=343403 RepID=A0A7H9ASD2_9FLAO|nr:aldose epimerase family protein [Costertonia aggregata]QLG46349.1 galactose mutarotase [Costertonia aggregata]
MKQVTIKNERISLTVIDYGAIIQKLEVPDNQGRKINVVTSLNKPKEYLSDTYFLGACIGRYAGRISNGSFVLNGNQYSLHSENGVHLHGGKEGFGKKYWTFESIHQGANPFVKLSYLSKHGEEGYPGNLKATVTYQLIDSSLHIIHEAVTDKCTVVNLTNHSYFNLDSQKTIDHYDLQLHCSKMVETKPNLLPTGKLVDATNTDIDFTKQKKIHEIRLDTPFVINDTKRAAAMVCSEKSGIHMQVFTDQPAVVVYTPEYFPAICFETQNFPDAPNHNNFPSCVLRPKEKYTNATEFKFSTK